MFHQPPAWVELHLVELHQPPAWVELHPLLAAAWVLPWWLLAAGDRERCCWVRPRCRLLLLLLLLQLLLLLLPLLLLLLLPAPTCVRASEHFLGSTHRDGPPGR